MNAWLPRLKNNFTISGFAEAGRWDTRGFGEVTRLADSLASETDQRTGSWAKDPEDAEGELSTRAAAIPTPWAWAVEHARILQSPEDNNHIGAVNEWRGLLALVALRGWRSVNVELLPLHNPNRTQPPRFAAALRQLLPLEWGDPRQAWLNVNIIRANGKPVGMIVPGALFCPSVVKPVYGADVVPWMDKGRLSDPLKCLSKLEREALFDRVGGLRTALADGGGPGQVADRTDQSRTATIALLEKFAEELLPPRTARRIEPMAQPGALQQCLEGEIPMPEVSFQSDLWLANDRAGARNVIVMPGAKEVGSLGDAIFWKTCTIDQALRLSEKSGGEYATIHSIAPSCQALWSTDAIFEPKLIVLEGTDSVPGGFPIAGSEGYTLRKTAARMLLPLKAEMLQHLTPAQLYLQLRASWTSDSVTFVLTLPVEGDNGSGTGEIKLVKTYNNDDIYPIQNVPVLEMWPDVRREQWRTYYSILRGDPSSMQSAEPLFAGPGGSQVRRFEEQQLVAEIRTMQEYPEAFSIITPAGCGLLLLSAPDVVPVKPLTWTVGVDFGTSGTLACKRVGEGGIAEPIALPSRLRMITQGNQNERAVAMDRYFAPTITIPYQASGDATKDNYSILSAFLEPGDNSKEANIEPLKDGHIYFVQSLAAFRPQDAGVSIDLKWGADKERRRSKTFLLQLCLHICTEAAKDGVQSIEWRYSYPNSFTAGDKGSFLKIWTAIVEECRKRTGIDCTGPRAYSEGVAAAKSLAINHQVNLMRGVLCIDIGGGSSDITLWQDDIDRVKLHSSVRFAGRDLLSIPLQRAPKTLARLNAVFHGELDAAIGCQANLKAFLVTIDAILQQNGDLLLGYGAESSGDPGIESITEIVQVGIAGLFYYAGMSTRYAAEVAENYIPRMPHIYIAGNGSKLLHWACNGAFAPDAPFIRTLKRIFYLAAVPGDEPSQLVLNSFNVVLSPTPKQEVVLGLVEDAEWLKAQDDIQSIIVSGERFSYRDSSYVEDDRTLTNLKQEDIRLGIRSSRYLENFSNFLSLMNQSISEAEVFDISERIDDHYSRQRVAVRENERDILPDPIFLLALKFYLSDKSIKQDRGMPPLSGQKTKVEGRR